MNRTFKIYISSQRIAVYSEMHTLVTLQLMIDDVTDAPAAQTLQWRNYFILCKTNDLLESH